MLVSLMLLGALVGCSQAYPEGPPQSSCASMDPTGHGGSPRTDPAPFTIHLSQTSYAPGDTITVTISGASTLVHSRLARDVSGESGSMSSESMSSESMSSEDSSMEDTPAEEGPAANTAVENVSEESVSVESVSEESTSMEDASEESASVEDTPAEEGPAANTAVENVPEESTSVESVSEESASVESVSEESASVEDTPEEEVPAANTAVENAPEESASVESVSEESASVESVSEETTSVESVSEEESTETSVEEGSDPGTSPGNIARFRGLFVQFRRVPGCGNGAEPIGTFSVPVAHSSQLKTISCGGRTNSALSQRRSHSFETVTFTWTAPATGAGHLRLQATIVQSTSQYWTEVFSESLTDPSSACTAPAPAPGVLPVAVPGPSAVVDLSSLSLRDLLVEICARSRTMA